MIARTDVRNALKAYVVPFHTMLVGVMVYDGESFNTIVDRVDPNCCSHHPIIPVVYDARNVPIRFTRPEKDDGDVLTAICGRLSVPSGVAGLPESVFHAAPADFALKIRDTRIPAKMNGGGSKGFSV